MTTIKEVAKRVGVSPATVSRVLNSVDHPIKEETRQRVLDTVRQMNFASNVYAKGLSGRPNMIGLCLGFSLTDDPGCAYSLAGMTDGLHQVSRALGYHVLLDTSNSPDDKIGDNLFAGLPLAGALVVAPRSNSVYVKQLLARKIPFVVVGSRQYSECNFVDADNHSAGRMAVEHLASLGRDKIGCLGGPANFSPSLDMVLGFRSKIQELGLPSHNDWFARDQWTVENGRRMALKMLSLKNRPNSIFACTDFLALGALQAAQELGLKVPEDISIMGYDDYAMATMVHPKLSTFRHPDREMAIKAMTWLVEDIIPNSRQSGFHQELVMPQLVVRESCGGQPTQVEAPKATRRKAKISAVR